MSFFGSGQFSGFGKQERFGTQNSPNTMGAGGFGQSTTTPFGQTQTQSAFASQPMGNTFNSPSTPSGFTQPQSSGNFGQNQATPFNQRSNLFGAQSSTFGQSNGSFGSSSSFQTSGTIFFDHLSTGTDAHEKLGFGAQKTTFGQGNQAVRKGTAGITPSYFKIERENQVSLTIQHICSMDRFIGSSPEELRFEDYEIRQSANAPANNSGLFGGNTSTTGFMGQGTTLGGTTSTIGGFGQNPSNSSFGKSGVNSFSASTTSTPSGPFMQTGTQSTFGMNSGMTGSAFGSNTSTLGTGTQSGTTPFNFNNKTFGMTGTSGTTTPNFGTSNSPVGTGFGTTSSTSIAGTGGGGNSFNFGRDAFKTNSSGPSPFTPNTGGTVGTFGKNLSTPNDPSGLGGINTGFKQNTTTSGFLSSGTTTTTTTPTGFGQPSAFGQMGTNSFSTNQSANSSNIPPSTITSPGFGQGQSGAVGNTNLFGGGSGGFSTPSNASTSFFSKPFNTTSNISGSGGREGFGFNASSPTISPGLFGQDSGGNDGQFGQRHTTTTTTTNPTVSMGFGAQSGGFGYGLTPTFASGENSDLKVSINSSPYGVLPKISVDIPELDSLKKVSSSAESLKKPSPTLFVMYRFFDADNVQKSLFEKRSIAAKSGNVGGVIASPSIKKLVLNEAEQSQILSSPLFSNEARSRILSPKSSRPSNLAMPVSPASLNAADFAKTPYRPNQPSVAVPPTAIGEKSGDGADVRTAGRSGTLSVSTPLPVIVASEERAPDGADIDVDATKPNVADNITVEDDIAESDGEGGVDLSDLRSKGIEDFKAVYRVEMKGLEVAKPRDSATVVTNSEPKISSDLAANESDKIVKSNVPTIGTASREIRFTVSPSLDEMKRMSDEELSSVKDLIVSSIYGSVRWMEPVDVRGLCLDEVIVFSKNYVYVYPEEKKDASLKPLPGQGLNRPAVITLFIRFPSNPQEAATLEKRIFEKVKKQNGKWDPTNRTLTLSVDHFSGYGIEDSEEGEKEKQASESGGKLEVIEEKDPFSSDIKPIATPVVPFGVGVEEKDTRGQSAESEGNIRPEEWRYDGMARFPIVGTNYFTLGSKLKRGSSALSYDDYDFDNEEILSTYKKKLELPHVEGADLSDNDDRREFPRVPESFNRTQSLMDLFKYNIKMRMNDGVATRPDQSPLRSEFLTSEKDRIEIFDFLIEKVKNYNPKLIQLGMKNSLIYNSGCWMMDGGGGGGGPYLGRSFRVGWASGGVFVHGGRELVRRYGVGKEFVEAVGGGVVVEMATLHYEYSTLNIQRLEVSFFGDESFYEPYMAVHLQFSEVGLGVEDLGPAFSVSGRWNSLIEALLWQSKVDLKKVCGREGTGSMVGNSGSGIEWNFLRQIHQNFVSVWHLVKVLFGELHVASSTVKAVEDERLKWRLECMARSFQLDWYLRKEADCAAGEELVHFDRLFGVDGALEDDGGRWKLMALLLSCKRTREAIGVALSMKEFRLALLMTQIGQPFNLSRNMRDQLDCWEEASVLNKGVIKPWKLKVYSILAGRVEELVGVYPDWIRAFSMHFWYKCHVDPSASIVNAFNAYSDACISENSSELSSRIAEGDFEQDVRKRPLGIEDYYSNSIAIYREGSTRPNVKFPVPFYLSSRHPLASLFEDMICLGTAGGVVHWAPPFDIRYHLLRLYCDRTHSLNATLEPINGSPSVLDYGMSWLLNSVFEAMGTFPLCERRFELFLSFASQLEFVGLWRWSVYVLLHLPPSESRRNAIVDLICRHAFQIDSNVELFLQNTLRVPPEWLLRGKLLRAYYSHDWRTALDLELRLGSWDGAHWLIHSKLAPFHLFKANCNQSIFEQTFLPPWLLTALDRLSAHSSHIRTWSTHGFIYHQLQLIIDKINLITDQNLITNTDENLITEKELLENWCDTLTRAIEARSAWTSGFEFMITCGFSSLFARVFERVRRLRPACSSAVWFRRVNDMLEHSADSRSRYLTRLTDDYLDCLCHDENNASLLLF